MKYRTRGNSEPYGKPRVYLAGHPEDVKKYLNVIEKMIFEHENCVIYYQDTEDVCELSELSQMQLIILVVTRKFIHEENDAYKVVYPYAVEKHIPVLPILEDELLASDVNKLNQMLGDIQCLNPNSNNPSEINFSDKLSKFLKSVLVGDELAKKIRAAFDAYIFLSYRKKDREYANELIRLIHSNEFTRDIAIWFDEFLVAGENFNDAIKDALMKSDLFVLTVTPNLINERNYVQETEYPMALGANKKIFPVEMASTDRNLLDEQYQMLPECVKTESEQLFSEMLFDALASIAKRENDNDSQHTFFIGLAYLMGIDVEKNEEQGRMLITKAAEEGLPEAMEKLVLMYQRGDGVVRDREQAVAWQTKLIKRYQQIYEETNESEDAHKWVKEICELGEYYQELCLYDQAQNTYFEALDVSEAVNNRFYSDTSREDKAYCHDCIANIYLQKGDMREAEAHYIDAYEIFEQLFFEAYDPTLKVSGGISPRIANGSYQGMFMEELTRQDFGAMTGLTSMEFASPGGTIKLAPYRLKAKQYILALNKLSRTFLEYNDIAVAENLVNKTVALSRTLYRETQLPEDEHGFLTSCMYMGEVCLKQGKYGSARTSFGEAMKGFRRWHGERQDYSSKLELCESLFKLAGAYKEDVNSQRYDYNYLCEKATGYYMETIALAEELNKEFDNLQTKMQLAKCYGDFGDLYRKVLEYATFGTKDFDSVMQMYDQSRAYFEQAVTIYKSLDADDEILHNQECVKIYLGYAEIMELMGECLENLEAMDRETILNGVHNYYSQAMVIKFDVFKSNPEDPYRMNQLRQNYYKLERVQSKLGNKQNLKIVYEWTIQILEMLQVERDTSEEIAIYRKKLESL